MSRKKHRSISQVLLGLGIGAALACGEVEPDKFDSLLVPNLQDEPGRAGSASYQPAGGYGGTSFGNGGNSRGGFGNTSGSSSLAGSFGSSGTSNGGGAPGQYVDPSYKVEWRDLGLRSGAIAAAQACSNAAAGVGGNGFHLPTISELRTLVQGCGATMPDGACGLTNGCRSVDCYNAACDGCGGVSGSTCYAARSLLPNCARAWSSTVMSQGSVWGLDFQAARILPLDETSSANALCVRPATGSTPGSCSASSISTQLYAPASGTPTGFTVCAGQQLSFEATGNWCWGGVPDCSGPDGTPGRPQPGELPVTKPGSYFGALIGRVGGSVFHIGSSANISAPASGELELLMNDNVNSYADNSGQLLVTIHAPSYP
jgi:hypothetical protein